MSCLSRESLILFQRLLAQATLRVYEEDFEEKCRLAIKAKRELETALSLPEGPIDETYK